MYRHPDCSALLQADTDLTASRLPADVNPEAEVQNEVQNAGEEGAAETDEEAVPDLELWQQAQKWLERQDTTIRTIAYRVLHSIALGRRGPAYSKVTRSCPKLSH